MNDVPFEYLNVFCQIYLNDVLIYSKILKKYICYVRLILQKLIDTNLQVNIKKCEFHVQKINFLGVLLLIKDIRMSSFKIQVIIA